MDIENKCCLKCVYLMVMRYEGDKCTINRRTIPTDIQDCVYCDKFKMREVRTSNAGTI